jgi:hypothetical protein
MTHQGKRPARVGADIDQLMVSPPRGLRSIRPRGGGDDGCHADCAIVGQDQFLERAAPVSSHGEEPLLRHREDRPLRRSRLPVIEDSN